MRILHCIVSSEAQFETWWWPSPRAETCCLSNKYSTTLLVVFWLYYPVPSYTGVSKQMFASGIKRLRFFLCYLCRSSIKNYSINSRKWFRGTLIFCSVDYRMTEAQYKRLSHWDSRSLTSRWTWTPKSGYLPERISLDSFAEERKKKSRHIWQTCFIRILCCADASAQDGDILYDQ